MEFLETEGQDTIILPVEVKMQDKSGKEEGVATMENITGTTNGIVKAKKLPERLTTSRQRKYSEVSTHSSLLQTLQSCEQFLYVLCCGWHLCLVCEAFLRMMDVARRF